MNSGTLRILAGLAVLVSPINGQGGLGGVIIGMVRDPSGGGIPQADVLVRNVATAFQIRSATDRTGAFRILNASLGDYTIEVTAPGFRRSITTVERLGAGAMLRVEIPLQLGPLSESVRVESAAVDSSPEDAQLGREVRNLAGLPLISARAGRNILLLAGTLPGTLYPAEEGDFSVNGQRANANNFLVDGADANNLGSGGTAETPGVVSPNALAEFRVITGAMKAEYGGHTGSTVLLTTRSGGNELHIAASEILRNTVLNATPFFQNAVSGGTTTRLPNTGFPRRPQWNSNDYDFNAGGPVRREKTFFFLSYLGARQRQGDTRSVTVPSETERAHVNAIGTPEAKALLSLLPLASFGNTLFVAPSNALRRDQGLAKVEHRITAENRFGALYLIEDQFALTQFTRTPIAPGFGGTTNLRMQQVILTDSHAFSPRAIHEFRSTFHRRADNSGMPLNHTNLASLGFTGIVPDDPGIAGPPFVHISGFADFGNDPNTPRATPRQTIQASSNLSWLRKRHHVKFGAEFLLFDANIQFHRSNSGEITIDGGGTPRYFNPTPGLSASLNDFAHGFASRFQQGTTFRHSLRQRSVAVFAQDDWKWTSRLTFNLGLRWHYNTPLTDRHDRFVAFRPGQQSSVFPDAPAGVVYPRDTGISPSTYSSDWNNFGPRIGFAWDVHGDGKTAIRGGAGLFFETPSTLNSAGFMDAPPFSSAPAVNSTDFANPWPTSRVNPIPQPFPLRGVLPGEHFAFNRITPIGLGVIDPQFTTPYAVHWNQQVQRQFRQAWLVEVGYAGSRGIHLFNQRQINPAIPGPGANAGNTDSRRVWNQNGVPDPRFAGTVFGAITDFLTDASSTYHSLQSGVTRRLFRGLQMSGAYTWAHAIDNASTTNINQPRLVSNNRGGRADRGHSTHDVRHRLVFTGSYEVPGRGRLRGGWSVSLLDTFQTGLPFNILEFDDRCLCDSGNQRPDYLGGKIQFFDPRALSAVPGVPNAWFNPRLFRRVGSGPSWEQGAGRFGSLGRNPFHGPGINNWDFSVSKRIAITEKQAIQVRAELFNAFNHAQFTNPGITRVDDSNFGRVLSTRDPRVAQLSLRYRF